MSAILSFATLAAFAAALLVGGMLFFAAVTAPMVFTTLDSATAGHFIRRIFPVYYLVMFAFAAVAALAAIPVLPVDAGVLAVVAAAFVVARQGLMPRINALRDREVAGDTAAGARFQRLHRVSVWLNAAQFLAAAVILLRLIAVA
jgi:hypothetical protein